MEPSVVVATCFRWDCFGKGFCGDSSRRFRYENMQPSVVVQAESLENGFRGDGAKACPSMRMWNPLSSRIVSRTAFVVTARAAVLRDEIMALSVVVATCPVGFFSRTACVVTRARRQTLDTESRLAIATPGASFCRRGQMSQNWLCFAVLAERGCQLNDIVRFCFGRQTEGSNPMFLQVARGLRLVLLNRPDKVTQEWTFQDDINTAEALTTPITMDGISRKLEIPVRRVGELLR